MSLIKYHRPTNLLRFFDDPFTKALFNENATTRRPSVNIQENADGFYLELVAPGRNKEDFKLEVKDELLTISYEAKAVGTDEKPDYLRREYRIETFKRSFHLDPKVINEEAISATYEDGILKVTLPKREEALDKDPKQITVG